MVSKLSGFFQKIANFPDDFKTIRIFPDDCQFSGWFQNYPDFFRWLSIFRMFSKLSRFFQMTANFPDDLKTVRISPDDCHFLDDFNSYPLKNCSNNRYFWSKNPFSYISASFGPFMTFLISFAHFVRKVFACRMLLPGKFWVFAPLGRGNLDKIQKNSYFYRETVPKSLDCLKVIWNESMD